MKDIDGNRGWGWWVGITIFIFAAGVGGLNSYGQGLPPDVEDLLPHAVLLWAAETVQPFGYPGLGLELLGIADMDKDGDLDLVCSFDKRVLILAGDGEGGFTAGDWSYYEMEAYQEGMELPGRFVSRRWTPYELQEVEGERFAPKAKVFFARGAVGDLNGDGFPEVVVGAVIAPQTGEEILHKLYLFRNAAGKLERVMNLEVGFSPSALWLGEVDGDGVTDLFVAHVDGVERTTDLYVLRGEGGLRFADPKAVWRGEGVPFGLEDVDGDGILDLCLISEGTVMVLYGDEGFGRMELFSLPEEEEVRQAVLGDLNGDGLQDLVVITGRGLTTALQEEGRFVASGELALGARVWELWVADLDGDGAKDILVEVAEGHFDFLVIPGDGAGGLLGVVGSFVVPNAPYSQNAVALADVNGDGRVDAVFRSFAGASLRIYLNGGEPSGHSLHSASGKPLAAGDLNGDGKTDIVTAAPDGLVVLWNSGHGFIPSRFASGIPTPLAGAVVGDKVYVLVSRVVRGTEILAFSLSGKLEGRWRLSGAIPTLAVGDFDGDGREDLAVPTKEALFVLWEGESLVRYRWHSGDLSLIAAGDLDRDGVEELFAISTGDYAELVEVNLKERELHVGEPLLRLVALPLSLATGDIDGDGAVDVAVISAIFAVEGEGEDAKLAVSGASLGLVLSSGGVKEVELDDFPAGELPWPFDGLGIGEFTGDGIPDICYTTASGAGLYILIGEENGSFGETLQKDVPAGPLLVVDLDGNGQEEVVTITVGMASLLVVLWNGGGE